MRISDWRSYVFSSDLQIMQRDFSSSISILDVACQCRLSLSHFIRAFSNTVGIAPYAWFVQRRVQHAEALLTGTQLPIVQIALECGFTDQAHFTKAFRSEEHTSELQSLMRISYAVFCLKKKNRLK